MRTQLVQAVAAAAGWTVVLAVPIAPVAAWNWWHALGLGSGLLLLSWHRPSRALLLGRALSGLRLLGSIGLH